MSIEQVKAGISVLKDEVSEISTSEDVDALDGLLELVLEHLERVSLRTSLGVESLYGEVAIASALRGQTEASLAKRLHE